MYNTTFPAAHENHDSAPDQQAVSLNVATAHALEFLAAPQTLLFFSLLVLFLFIAHPILLNCDTTMTTGVMMTMRWTTTTLT